MPPMPHSYYQQHYYPNYQPFYNSAAAAWWAAYQPPAAGYYYGQYPDSSYAYSMQQYYESSAYPVVSSCFVLFSVSRLLCFCEECGVTSRSLSSDGDSNSGPYLSHLSFV